MNDPVSEIDLDDGTREALERIRQLWVETLPLLAVIETVLQIPDEERYVGREFMPTTADGEQPPYCA